MSCTLFYFGGKDEKIFIYLLCFIFLLSMQRNVYAVGEGNIDGGGGGMGHGTSEYYWNSGDDGVRVTIIRDSDNTAVSTPVDFTNRHPDNIQFHFGKVSKIQYRNGALLIPTTSTYLYNNPEQPLPRIVSSDGNVNIAANTGR